MEDSNLLTQSTNTKPVHLVWDEDALLILQAPEWLKSRLTISEKKLVCDKTTQWVRETKVIRTPIYNVLSEEPLVLQTYQGLWKRVSGWLQSKGLQVVFSDQRANILPAPRLELMTGFRFNQRELLTKFLLHECSGLLEAPTRYGKTTLIINTIKAYPTLQILVVAPGADLVKQLFEQIKAAVGKHRSVVLLGAGSRTRTPSEDITVCSMDSLHLCDKGSVDLILIDEPHAAVTESRLPELDAFTKARRLAYGATPTGRFDGKDRLVEGLIGPILERRTYQEAVAEGAICPLSVLFLRVPIDRSMTCRNRDVAYDRVLFMNDGICDTVRDITQKIIPADWQTLIFVKHENQADKLLESVGESGTIAMAKKLTTKQRTELMSLMQSDRVKRCLATKIYAQGVTFSALRCMINCEAGGNNTSAIQKPGRLAEVIPGKKCGIVIDFLFDTDPTIESGELQEYMDSMPGSAWVHVIRDSRSRMKAYTDKGYDVVVVNDLAELQTEFSRRI